MGKKLLGLSLLPMILIFHTAAALAFLAGTRAVERAVCRIFEEYFNGTLVLEHAAFDIFSGLRFQNISVTPGGEALPVFTARSIVLDCGGSDLLMGRIRPRAITVNHPVITLKQAASRAFTFDYLIKKQEFEDMVQEKMLPEEKRVSTLIITDGLIKLEGEGPLPRAVRAVLAPDRQAAIRVPVFHWVDAGGPSLKWAFGGILQHDALGEIQSEGLVDGKGLNRFFLRFVDLDLNNETFSSFISEDLRKGVERSGFDGKALARFVAERDPEGRLACHIAFGGFDLYPARYFPVSLKGVQGRLNLEKDLLRITDTTARACGGIVHLDGTLDLANELTCEFLLRGEGIRFSSELERGVEKIGGGNDYRAFAARGEGDFTYRGRLSRTDPRIRGELVILPRNPSASYEGYSDPLTGWKDSFPYRVHDLTGTIRVQPGLVEIKTVEGHTEPRIEVEPIGRQSARGRVVIDGRIGTSSSDRSTKLDITGQDVPLDDRLREAIREMDPKAAERLDVFNAEGLVDFEVRIDRRRGDDRRPVILARLKDVRACYEGFPYPLERLSGLLRLENGLVTLESLKGYPAPALEEDLESASGAGDPEASSSSSGSGAIDPRGRNRSGGIFLEGRLRNDRLDPVVIRGLQQPITPLLKEIVRDVLGKPYRFLCDLDYEGTVDFELTLEGEGQDLAMVLDLDLHLDRVSGGRSPVPIEDLRGRVHFDAREGVVEARDLDYSAGGGRIALRSFKLYEREGLMLLDIEGTARHLNLGSDFSRVWGKEVQEDWSLLDCGGELDLDAIAFHAALDKDGSLVDLDSRLEVRLNGAGLTYPVAISDTFGRLNLTVAKDPAKGGGVLVKGKSQGLSFTLSERLFTGVEAEFVMDKESLAFSRFQGNFYGGKVSGIGETPIHVDLDPPHAFAWRLWAEDADLRYVFSRKDYAFRNVSGRLTGTINLKGDLDHVHRTLAEGDVHVEKGSLFELPLFGNISRLMGNIFSTDPPTFDGGEALFKFKEGTFQLSDIELHSSIMKLNGQGVVSVDGVDLNFIPSTTIVPNIPILGHIVNLIKDGLFRFRIYGPYSDLKVSYEPIVNRLFTADRVKDEPRYMGRKEFAFTERF